MDGRITWSAARKNAGLTQAAAAEKIGVTMQTLGNWENYKTFPDADKIMKMCELYHRSVDNIFLTQCAN